MNENTKRTIAIILFVVALTIFFIFPLFISVFSVLGLFDGDGSSNTGSGGLVNSNEQISISSSSQYWWPIGGSEVEIINGVKYTKGTPTSINVTSKFSLSRTVEGVTKPHRGIDIGHNNQSVNYIIASKEGKVYKTYKKCATYGSAKKEDPESDCGGSYGNHVIIEHTDGNYTIYAHMAKNTITVNEGDAVQQGQIIGEMGSSGRSTGPHLHFQIDVGGYSQNKAEDPLKYVNPQKPRPTIDKLKTMLNLFEGSGPTEGDYYIAYQGKADAKGIITIGHGIVIQYNVEKFKARGYSDPINQIKEGTKVKKSIINEIEEERINEDRVKVINGLSNNNISLSDYQIDALTSRRYNTGNISNFYRSYEKYGVTQALYDNYMSKPVISNGNYQKGLEIRRQREWKLFYEGLYYGVDYK